MDFDFGWQLLKVAAVMAAVALLVVGAVIGLVIKRWFM